MKQTTYKMIVAYDGTDFQGWQVQPHGKTVASRMQKTFEKVFGHSVTILAASRTDTGVHALCQVARVRMPAHLNGDNVLEAWNSALPPSIVIRSLQIVSDDYNPFANVVQKTYWYHLFYKRPLPFIARYGWYYEFVNLVDFTQLDEALQVYVGQHDFGSFCKVEDKNESTVRTIDSITLKRITHYGIYRIAVQGKGFARFQIRRMIGYALDVVRRKDLDKNYLIQLLNTPHPRQTLLKAGASGLCLRKIEYEKESS